MISVTVDETNFDASPYPVNYNVVISSNDKEVSILENNTNVSIEETNTNVTVGNVSSVIYYNTGGAGITYSANYGDSTPVLIYSLSSLDTLSSIDVFIEESFNGVDCSISIGTVLDHEKFFSTIDSDVYLQDTYFTKEQVEEGPFDVLLYINNGTGNTQGKVKIQVSVLPKG